MTESNQTVPATGKPALPCPPWCTSGHGEDRGISQHHATERPVGDFETGWVALLMIDYSDSSLAGSNGEMHIHVNWRRGEHGTDVKTVTRPLGQAGALAEAAEALGRDDVAALIRELAELAGTPGAR